MMPPHLARQALRKARLYGILDTGYSDPASWPDTARRWAEGGVQILQIRAKNATPADILAWTLPVRAALPDIPLILNDHPDLVGPSGADGCHVGQDDLPVSTVRSRIDRPILVGKSTHSLEQARMALAEQPDYIGVGPLFATPTKPDYIPIGLPVITQIRNRVPLPQFCIGGIKLENLPAVLAAGALRVVIVSGLLQAPDPAAYAREVRRLLDAVPLPDTAQ
jgi:thiamine-phosphate pyrophosphorylase